MVFISRTTAGLEPRTDFPQCMALFRGPGKLYPYKHLKTLSGNSDYNINTENNHMGLGSHRISHYIPHIPNLPYHKLGISHFTPS